MKRNKNIRTAARLLCVILLASVLLFQSVSADEIILPPPGISEAPLTGHIVDEDNGYYAVDSEGNICRSEVETLWASSSAYPSNYDLRNVNGKSYVTRPECQYSGNCWSFASMSALESNVMKQGFDEPHFSKTHLTYFAKKPANEGYFYDTPFSVGGNIHDTIGTLSNLEGIADKSVFPNNLSVEGVTYAESDRYNRGSGYILDEAVFLSDTDKIKDWIMENGAVYVSVFQTSLNNGYMYNDSRVWDTNTGALYPDPVTNHGITIIGWDDSIPASAFTHTEPRYSTSGGTVSGTSVSYTPSLNGAWIVKNSVGLTKNDVPQEYYDENYMYLSYSQVLGSTYGLKAQQDPGINGNYTYTERYPNYYYYGKNARIANVFTADDAGYIDQVGFIVAPNAGEKLTDVTATIRVYKNIPSGYTYPSDGTCVCTNTAHYYQEGYYTYDFPTKIPVSRGEIFSVEITLQDSANCSLQIPYEWQSTNFSNPRYTAGPKQSYYSFGDPERTVIKDIYSVSNFDMRGNIFMHVYTTCTHSETVERTNSQNANRVDIYCATCGKYIRTECKVHTLKTEKGYEASCLTEGLTDRIYCSECGYVEKESTVIPPLGHLPVTDKGYPKTCTADGLTDGSHCGRCSTVLQPQTVIPKGHNIVVDHGTPATCQQAGLTDGWHCTACDAKEPQTQIPPTSHKDTNGDGLCDTCSTLLDSALHNKYLLDHVVINAPKGGTVDYKNKVAFNASVQGQLPEGYYIAVFDGGSSPAATGNTSVSYTSGELAEGRTFTVKIMAPDGSAAKKSDGNEISSTIGVNVTKNIFKVIIAFFRSIFGGQPTKNI